MAAELRKTTDKNANTAYPIFTTKTPTSLTNKFKIHIAIDFGTDGIALAYAVDEKVFVHTEWASIKYTVDVKPKTIILLDENNNALAFGKDAKHTYMSVPTMRDKWMLFERFKMSLYDKNEQENKDNDDEKKDDKISIEDKLTATNGKTLESKIVFVAAFKHLQELAKQLLKKKKIKNIKDSDIQWIITVPAIWNDEAKYKMRQWTIDAGLVDANIEDQCKIVYEPDCASLSIQYEINQRKTIISNLTDDAEDDDDYKTDINDGSSGFSKGEKYILVDAGGGTVDIACHEILGANGELGVKEVLHPSGGSWGSCYIDDQFIELLKSLFSAEWFNEFKKQKPDIYTQLLHNFQKSKERFYENTEQIRHNVRLPIYLIGFMQDKFEENDQDLEEIIPTRNVFGKTHAVSILDEYLEIDSSIWKLMFNHVMDPTIAHIKKLMDEPKLMRCCKYLCLVGGLSTSPYFQAKMVEQFGPKSKYRLNVIIPKRPILSVVEGAAYFGITKNYIKARVLRYTYGEILHFIQSKAITSGISSEYINKNKVYNEEHENWYVKNCFGILARKNEEIYTGQIKKSESSRWSATTMSVSTDIMFSTMEQPKVASDGKKLGSIVTEWNNQNKSDMDIMLEFHFYDTLIKVITYPKSRPNDTEIRYITSYK